MMARRRIDNRKIARNTLFLYCRMLLVLLVSLYTARVVLHALGVVDYGIHNVVAGVVVMFGSFQTMMSSAAQRFISVEMARGDSVSLKKVFGVALSAHLCIALGFIIIVEAVGLWLLKCKLSIPAERMDAAFLVFHCTTVSLFISIAAVPFNAGIVSSEKMGIYAGVGVLEVLLKLAVAFILCSVAQDRLKLYALLLLVVNIVVNCIYAAFCRGLFEESRTRPVYDKGLFAEMFSFVGWNISATFATAVKTQGSNILLNVFFGPAVNAARGVAGQIRGGVDQLIANLVTASNPQVFQSYAAGDHDSSVDLSLRISRYSFFLILCVSLPVIFNVDELLALWLVEVPAHSSAFIVMVLSTSIVSTLTLPQNTLVKATGEIKWFMLVQSFWHIACLPVIWLMLERGGSPESAFAVLLAFEVVGIAIRLVLIRNVTDGFTIRKYIISVLGPTVAVAILAIAPGIAVKILLPGDGLGILAIRFIAIFVITFVVCAFAGLRKAERRQVVSLIWKRK